MTSGLSRGQPPKCQRTAESENYEWMSILGATLVLVLFVGLTLIAIGGWDWFLKFLDSSASGWVQAFGSIAAIYGAFSVANRQQKTQIAKENEVARQQRRQRLETCREVLIRAQSLFEAVAKIFGDQCSLPVLRVLRKEITQMERMVNSLPMFEIPDTRLVHRFSLLNQSIDHLALTIDRLERDGDFSKMESYALDADKKSSECFAASLYCFILIKACSSSEELKLREEEEIMLKTIERFVEHYKKESSSGTDIVKSFVDKAMSQKWTS